MHAMCFFPIRYGTVLQLSLKYDNVRKKRGALHTKSYFCHFFILLGKELGVLLTEQLFCRFVA